MDSFIPVREQFWVQAYEVPPELKQSIQMYLLVRHEPSKKQQV
jgi:hypothetical protein